MLESAGRRHNGEAVRAAAQRLGLAFANLQDSHLCQRVSPSSHLAAARVGRMASIETGGARSIAVALDRIDQDHLAAWLSQRPAGAERIVAATGDDIAALYLRDAHAGIVATAVSALETRLPAMSARRIATPVQAIGLLAGLAALGWAVVLAPHATAAWAALVLALFFVAATALRLIAILGTMPGSVAWSELAGEDLPVYSVLVPLFREAVVVPELVTALKALDYPADRLDIKLLLEADDAETLEAVAAADLPKHFSVLALPDLGPRTKPKALCVGLALARGQLVCVFDAEDAPEPGQLRQAAGAFALARREVACLQARLAYRNWGQSLLTRQFAIEYAAQFDVLVPALSWLGLPVPLGGTSNHFRTSALREAGGWDPHNVTEDADLGLRLARLGYRVGVIDATTYEEAPAGVSDWMKQRTRWMKGWMQTVLVHTRNPLRLLLDLGLLGSFGFAATVAANLMSAILHPVALGLIGYQISHGRVFAGTGALADTVATLASANLVFGYAAALACAAVGLYRRPMPGLAWHLALTPVYWLMSAVAFVLAAIDLVRRPHFWAKTEHGKARSTTPAGLRRKRPARRR